MARSETLQEFWGVPCGAPDAGDLEREFHRHLHEGYQGAGRAGGSSLVRAYYRVKPFLPRPLQIWARQRHARARQRITFPRWPVETRCWDIASEWIRRAASVANGRVPALGFWPEGRSFALVLTHDVEHQAGFEAIKIIAS